MKTKKHGKPLAFSFATFAEGFDSHIRKSIRGYAELRSDCLALSRYFVENDSVALDIGCSTGRFLLELQECNREHAPLARYVGIDIEPGFRRQWQDHRGSELSFEVADVRSFALPRTLSFVTAIFTLQFLPERDRLAVLKRIHRNLGDGGALIIAEKSLAKSAKIQDMLTFLHYDFKRTSFSESEILEKEHSLRDKMKPWTEARIVRALRDAGFADRQVQVFWRNHSFVGILAVKSSEAGARPLSRSRRR